MPSAEEVFERTYAAYGPALYRFCLVQMGNGADAEDVLQEVFCKRLYRAPEFGTAEQERRWLFRVAANQCRDELRRSRRTEVPLAEGLPAPDGIDLGLWELVAALPEKQRTVIHLRYAEGWTVEEIAAILGTSVPAVKMRLKRGRDALRKEWEAER
nr:sigma-70 family RNA polymerase sigma factor [uncultured Dysosmobacter sp.]